MHLRNHLEAFILDHGPVTAFRVLALNDLMNSMGSERTNKRPVELQIVKQFSSTRFHIDENEHYDEDPLAKEYIHCMTRLHSIQFIS